MNWPTAFFYCFLALLAAPLVYLFAIILLRMWDDVNGISWPFKRAPTRRTETTTTPETFAAVQNVCHNRKCPGYGKSLAHKCHDLDCKLHPKEASA